MAQKRTYSQMPLPFDRAELRKPVRPVAPVARVAIDVPSPSKGLRELAAAESLSPERCQRLLGVASTVRGKYPVTVEEWRELDNLLTLYVDEKEPL